MRMIVQSVLMSTNTALDTCPINKENVSTKDMFTTHFKHFNKLECMQSPIAWKPQLQFLKA